MAATDKYAGSHSSVDQPADDIVPVTLDEDFTYTSKAIYIETGGDISIVTKAGNTRIIAVPDNFILPIRAVQVTTADTTATGLWYFV